MIYKVLNMVKRNRDRASLIGLFGEDFSQNRGDKR